MVSPDINQCVLWFKIVDPTGDLKQGQIYDSNRSTLLSALKEQGFRASDVGIARDRVNESCAVTVAAE